MFNKELKNKKDYISQITMIENNKNTCFTFSLTDIRLVAVSAEYDEQLSGISASVRREVEIKRKLLLGIILFLAMPFAVIHWAARKTLDDSNMDIQREIIRVNLVQEYLEIYFSKCKKYPPNLQALKAEDLSRSDRYIPTEIVLKEPFKNYTGEEMRYSSDGLTYSLKLSNIIGTHKNNAKVVK